MNVLQHRSTSKLVLNVALSSPRGYQMSLRLVWVICHTPHGTRLCMHDYHKGGEGGSEGGRAKGVWLAPPPSRVPLWSLPKAGLLPPKQNFGCHPQALEGEEGSGGYPPPPTMYGRSNTPLWGGRGAAGLGPQVPQHTYLKMTPSSH